MQMIGSRWYPGETPAMRIEIADAYNNSALDLIGFDVGELSGFLSWFGIILPYPDAIDGYGLYSDGLLAIDYNADMLEKETM